MCCKNQNKPNFTAHDLSISPNIFLKVLMFLKAKADKTSCKNLNYFNKVNFNQDLQNRLSEESAEEYVSFENIVRDIFKKHAPFKKNNVCAYCP